MTFLKKLGNILRAVLQLATGIGPLVAPYLGSKGEYASVVINDLTQIANVVVDAEAMISTPGSGAMKLAAATPLVLQILRSSQAFSGKKIANEALAEQGASKIVSGLADFMNAIDQGEAKTA